MPSGLHPIASGSFFTVQIKFEAGRLATRRLRYEKSGIEVHAPAVRRADFHLFLSHVWGTGQDQMRIVKQVGFATTSPA